MADALDLLTETACGNHACLVARNGDEATFVVSPPKASGAPALECSITIRADRDRVSARETVPMRLPAFCPERHINHDGSFCLFWVEDEDLKIASSDAAGLWWGKLLAFLLRQETAAAMRRWPGDARAHGDAAYHQRLAETCATELGTPFTEWLREQRLTVVSRRHGDETRKRLELDGSIIASVAGKSKRVMTSRSPCKCAASFGRKRAIADCGDHADVLAQLILAIDRWKVEESRFFAKLKAESRKCCGTIEGCPLAA